MIDNTAGWRSRRAGGRLTLRAYDALKTRLLDGQYGAGARIVVDDLVAELGASRQPVMDALKRLANEGYVEILPQVGCRVAVPLRQDILDYFRLFARAEGLCAELAAERADDDDIERLAAVSARIGALAAGPPSPRRANGYHAFNRDFHGLIHAIAATPVVAAVAADLWDRADFYISAALGTHLFADRVPEAHVEHEAVLAALAARDPARARAAMEAHIMGFGRAAAQGG